MKITLKITNSGISIATGEGADAPPEKSKDANQSKPRKSYVYAHLDKSGNVFYIGKGIGHRAWDKKRRHSFWQRYLDTRSDGSYTIEILNDNLTDEDATYLESEWIAHHSSTLINWVNSGRQTDFKALQNFHRIRNANKSLIAQARLIEKTSLEQAISIYMQALEAIPAYNSIKYEKGLVADLMEEECQEIGLFGEVDALERLVMCLLKQGRIDEANKKAEEYFETYRGDRNRVAYTRTMNRLKKAMEKQMIR